MVPKEHEGVGSQPRTHHMTPSERMFISEKLEECRRAHWINIEMRIGGTTQHRQADWLKQLAVYIKELEREINSP